MDRRIGFWTATLAAAMVIPVVLMLIFGANTKRTVRTPDGFGRVFSHVEHRIALVRGKMSGQVRESESIDRPSTKSENRYRKRLTRLSRKLVHEAQARE